MQTYCPDLEACVKKLEEVVELKIGRIDGAFGDELLLRVFI